MNIDTIGQLLELAKKHGAASADAVLFEKSDLNSAIRLGKPEAIERSESSAAGLRVFVKKSDGEIGIASASSSDISENSLKELAERVVSMAKLSPADSDSTLADSSLFPKNIPDLDLLDANEPAMHLLEEQCAAAEDAALSVEGITNSEGASAGYGRSHVALATSEGFFGHYESSYFSFSVSVLAGSGTSMERDYDFSSARHRSDLREAKEIGLSAANRALKRLNPRKISSCKIPVIFDPRVSKSLVSILTGSISGSSVARGASFLKDSMGEQIFGKNIRIIDDPHIVRGLSSKPFDMEAVANKKTVLVEDGILRSWLLDIRTANKLGLKTAGHASRGLSSPPSPSSTNCYMEKGDLSPQELISDIKHGLYLTETFGMGVNTVTGDYSQGAAGFMIENGEITYPVSEITIAGNLRDMFLNAAPANDLTFRYSTNAPTVRVENMTIAGT